MSTPPHTNFPLNNTTVSIIQTPSTPPNPSSESFESQIQNQTQNQASLTALTLEKEQLAVERKLPLSFTFNGKEYIFL